MRYWLFCWGSKADGLWETNRLDPMLPLYSWGIGSRLSVASWTKMFNPCNLVCKDT